MRLLRLLAVAIVIGTLANVVVAWMCMAWQSNYPDDSTLDFDIARGVVDSAYWIEVHRSRYFGATFLSEVRGRSQAGMDYPADFAIPRWARTLHRSADHIDGPSANDLTWITWNNGFGWPLISLWYEVRGNVNDVNSMRVRGGLLLREPEEPGGEWGGFHTILPFRPHWSGFLFDTLFYSFGVSLLFAAFVSLRRQIRMKCRRCVFCGYPVQDQSSRCPECGNPRRLEPLGFDRVRRDRC